MFPSILILFFIIFIHITSAIKIVALDVPSPATQGESAELTCSYELENDRLYSIKWYKNGTEFYRYIRNDWPPGQFLILPGVSVDIAKSDRRSVFLKDINMQSAGIYRCEVSADGPDFHTAEAEKEMTVIVLPTEGPKIFGGKPKYDVGDVVAITCISAKSKPASTLQWFINDQPNTGEYETEYSKSAHEDEMETSSLSLRFVATQRHFKEGEMRLRCTATVSGLHTMSDEKLFVSEKQQTSQLQVDDDLQHSHSEQTPVFVEAPATVIETNSESSGAELTSRGILLVSSFLYALLHR